VVENEITKGILEVLELEFADRITSSVSYAVQLNESVAASDIAGILEVADKNADGELTGDELYELIFGRPIDPAWQRLAANWVVLKAPQFAEDRWERWRSLLLAPWVSRLSRLAQLSRSVAEWARNWQQPRYKVSEPLRGFAQRLSALGKLLRRLASPEKLSFAEAYAQLTGSSPPDELLRSLPALGRLQFNLPKSLFRATEAAALVQRGTEQLLASVFDLVAAVQDGPIEAAPQQNQTTRSRKAWWRRSARGRRRSEEESS